MLLQYKNLLIRNATVGDASLLEAWWNDGKIMAHAGFPLGTGEKAQDIAQKIQQDSDDTHRRLIIELDSAPIGEMSYYNLGNQTAEIGIKICDFSKQNKGLGKILLSMLFTALFDEMNYETILINTNLKNERARHVYECLGATQVGIRIDAWRNQLGELQSTVDYRLGKNNFISFVK